jgi:glutamyl-tRNA reductase
MQECLATSRRLRDAIGLERGRTSVASVGLDLTRQVLGPLRNRHVAVLGAGEIAKAVLRHAMADGPARVTVLNRTVARAAQLLDALQASASPTSTTHQNLHMEAAGLDALETTLLEADLLIASAHAPRPLVEASTLKRILRRRSCDLVMLDLAVPRNIDPACAKLDGAWLYDIDALQSVVSGTQSEREQVREDIEPQLQTHAKRIHALLLRRDLGPLARELRTHLEQTTAPEIDRTLRRLMAAMPDADATAVRSILLEQHRRMLSKVMHLPLSSLSNRHCNTESFALPEALRHLFGLDISHHADATPAATAVPTVGSACHQLPCESDAG